MQRMDWASAGAASTCTILVEAHMQPSVDKLGSSYITEA